MITNTNEVEINIQQGPVWHSNPFHHYEWEIYYTLSEKKVQSCSFSGTLSESTPLACVKIAPIQLKTIKN